jgi:phosphopentomutase
MTSRSSRQPNYLTLLREAGHVRRQKIGDIFAGQDIDESHPTKSNVEGSRRRRLLRPSTRLRVRQPGRTDMLWGHRNDPISFHRCLRNFDRRLSDLLDALAGDSSSSPPTMGVTRRRPPPTTRASTRLRVSCTARTRTVGSTKEFADVGATVNTWLGRKAPGRRLPGQPIVEP